MRTVPLVCFSEVCQTTYADSEVTPTSIGPRVSTGARRTTASSMSSISARFDALRHRSKDVAQQRAAQRPVPQNAPGAARADAERALEVLATTDDCGAVTRQAAEGGAELVVEGLELFAAAGFEALTIGHVEEELAGRVHRLDLADIGLLDVQLDAGRASVGAGGLDGVGVAIGGEYGR